jgi:dienelactone hydrolase
MCKPFRRFKHQLHQAATVRRMSSISIGASVALGATVLLACIRERPASVPAGALAGRWEGQVHLDYAAQRLVVDVEGSAPGRAVLMIPELLRRDTAGRIERIEAGIRLIVVDGPMTLRFEGPRQGDTLTLRTVSPDGPAAGEPPPPMRMRLVRQGPVPPARVRFEELVVRGGDLSLHATLVSPATRGPHPAVVLLHGSGAHTREPLIYLARHFAEHGFAALAADKRPVVSIAGGDELTRREDLAADAVAAVELLSRHPDVKRDAIGVWGGSQGSGVAAAAAARSPLVSFVVGVSGGGTEYTPFVVYQTTNRMRALGRSEADIALARDLVVARHEYLRRGGDSSRLVAMLRRGRGRMEGSRIPMSVPTEDERRAWARAGHLTDSAAAPWRNVRVPVLAMWGGRDALVPAEESARHIEAALRAGGSPDVTACIVADADHVMMLPRGPGAGDGGGFAFPRLSPAFVHGMVEWMRARAGLAAQGDADAALRAGGCVKLPGAR